MNTQIFKRKQISLGKYIFLCAEFSWAFASDLKQFTWFYNWTKSLFVNATVLLFIFCTHLSDQRIRKRKASKWPHWITLQLYALEKPTFPQINFLLKIFCFLVNLFAPLFVFSLHRHHLFLEWLMAAVTIFDKNIGRKKTGVSIWSRFKVLYLF